jgi:hypothetical protein
MLVPASHAAAPVHPKHVLQQPVARRSRTRKRKQRLFDIGCVQAIRLAVSLITSCGSRYPNDWLSEFVYGVMRSKMFVHAGLSKAAAAESPRHMGPNGLKYIREMKHM